MAASLPQPGDIIVFSTTPTASYTSPGEEYIVSREGKFFDFRSVSRGSATQDPAWAVKRSIWTKVN